MPMMSNEARGFVEAWQELNPAFRRSLELAYQSLMAGGLAVGAVLTDAEDYIIAEGRNRAYDAPGGPDVLQGTPLAHAEMNVLAVVRQRRELGSCILWSTQEPCSMCAAAAAFTGVGAIRYIAPDPSALAAEPQAHPATPPPLAGRSTGPAADLWVVTANVLFLLSVANRAGLAHRTVVRNRELEPETAGIVVGLMSAGLGRAVFTEGQSLSTALPLIWDRLLGAAATRQARVRHSLGQQEIASQL